MAFLKTDSGEYRQLPVPAILSVGRSSTNDIRPSASQSKSMSATHAQISLSYVPNTDNRVEAYIEDIGSRFGTFVGFSPLEIERISGKTKLLYGQYIRFGHSSSYFQYLDKIPSYVEILPPELVVTPTKQFQRELLNYSSAPNIDLTSSNANYSSSQLDTAAVEKQQLSTFFPMSMNGDGDHSFISSPKPAMKAHSSMSQQDASSPTQSRQQQQQSLSNSSNFQRVKFLDNSNSNNDDTNNNNNSEYTAARSGSYRSHNSHYDDDNSSSSSSMQISVNYPTTGGQGLHQPISITIDPTSTSASRIERRSRPVSTANQHQPMMGAADSSSSLRYSSQSTRSKAVSPIQEGRYEQHSPDESLGLNVIQSDDDFDRGGRKKGLGSNSYSYDYYGGGESTRDAVEQLDDYFEPYQTASNRNSMNNNDSNNYSNNYSNNNNNNASKGNKDRYRNIDTINSLMAATNPPPLVYDQSSKGNGSSSSRMPRKKPQPALDSMEALQKLSSKSTSWKEVSKASSSNSKSHSRSPVDPALNSSYYYDRLNRGGGGGTDKSGMSQQQQQQQLSKHIDYQAKLGDNGLLMEAIQPNDTKLVRRSWPEELRCPSSDIISRFVDNILAQEQGTTQKEYQLYQSIFREQNRDKHFNKDDEGEEDEHDISSSTYPILSHLRLNPVKCDLPSVIPDDVMSEAVAEALMDKDRSTTGTIGTAITKLNDLMRQCLLGTNLDSNLPQSSIDFDQVLLGVVTDIIKSSVQSLRSAQQSNLVKALEGSRPENTGAMTGAGASAESSSSRSRRSNIGLLLQQCIDSLTRIISFLHGMYLHDEARAIELQTNDTYEVVALSLSSILNKLDACNVSIWSIGQQVDQVTMEHVVTRSGGFLKSSLSLELEELRKLKRDSELIPLVERIRQQESSILERKLFRLHKVFDIILQFNLQSALWHWRMAVRKMKHHELGMIDLCNRREISTKRMLFKKWFECYKVFNFRRKTLRRFGRVISSKGLLQLRRSFKQWELCVRKTAISIEASMQIAKLRNELCNLKATLHELTNRDEIAASLAAEKALNRELSSSNLELRNALQQNESKLLECGGVVSSRRKDLVYHHLVIDKEEELAAMKRENKFLHSELEHLRLLSTRRLPSSSSSPSAAANGIKGGGLHNNNNNYQGNNNNNGSSNNYNNANRLKPITSADKAITVGVNTTANPDRYNPSRYKPTADRPNDDISFMMSKDEAKMVILSEVRRLKDSHAVLQANRNQLNNKMIEETTRNVQLTIGIQSLQSRITAMERSANALRELLRQKFGDQGIIHLMESLEMLGAGSNVLLEVPVSKTANVILDGTGSDANATTTVEHHRDSSSRGSSRQQQQQQQQGHTRDDPLMTIGGRRGGGFGVDESKGGDRFALNSSGSGGSGGSGGVGVESGRSDSHPYSSNSNSSSSYSKAIEEALYR